MKAILIVEDSPDLCAILVQELRNADFSPVVATNLREAMVKLKNQIFACIVLDVHLGGEDGTDLVDFVRQRRDLQNTATPIILASGNINPHVLKRVGGQVQGAFVKPFFVKDLIEHLKKILAKEEQEKADQMQKSS